MEKIISSFFTKKPTLIICLIMDVVGMASYLFPALGEWSDTVWAPIAAYLFNYLFGGVGGLLGGAFSFLEEIIPFTDIIPTFTIAWMIQNSVKRNLQPKSNSNSEEIEDVEAVVVDGK